MRIMTIDPGDTTGIVIASLSYASRDEDPETALVTIKQAWEVAGESVVPELDKLHSFPNVVVVERSPILSTNAKQNALFHQLLQFLSFFENTRIIVVSPGEWKPIAKAQRWSKTPPLHKSQHVQDAINILRYWALREFDSWRIVIWQS